MLKLKEFIQPWLYNCNDDLVDVVSVAVTDMEEVDNVEVVLVIDGEVVLSKGLLENLL